MSHIVVVGGTREKCQKRNTLVDIDIDIALGNPLGDILCHKKIAHSISNVLVAIVVNVGTR